MTQVASNPLLLTCKRHGITCHVLDTSLGRPAKGVPATLGLVHPEEGFEPLADGVTDDDGRITNWVCLEQDDAHKLSDPMHVGGVYKIHFSTRKYFQGLNQDTFFPSVEVTFAVEARQHYHVALLLSPYSYTTYRGS